MSEGKKFEDDFKLSFSKTHKDRILRLFDTTNGFKGIANPCDFVYYAYPKIGFLELKSIGSNRLPLSNISKNQLEQLTNRSRVEGVLAGIVVQYRPSKKCYLIPIQVINYFKKRGWSSIPIAEAEAFGMEIPLYYKRVRCRIDPAEFMRLFLEYEIPEEFIK